MKKIGIIGLGYVGLPLALEFSKKYSVIGYDRNLKRIEYLKKKLDINNDLQKDEINILKNSKNLSFTSSDKDLFQCNIFIVSVPTPIYKNKDPDFRSLISATKTISNYLKKNDLVVYESTVYPGATEEICKPILESAGFILNKDFYIGYSPERLSPGDPKHGLKKIIKITSGSNPYARKLVDKLYKSIIPKGTYSVSSIKVAEAAKVIENIQRDVNIALINELAITFSKLKINTHEVLKAAETKWNFVRFQPGLVGGHCIAVDPYYLYFKSKKEGYDSRLIPMSRKINDKMSNFVVNKFLTILKDKALPKKKNILIMGLAYKENSSDTRNSPVFKIYKKLKKNINIKKIHIYDPLVDYNFFKKKIQIISKLKHKYDGILITVPHDCIIKDFNKSIKKITHQSTKILDVKYAFTKKKGITPL